MPKPVKHIAVIRLSAMGDVAMTVPLLKAFADQYPDAKITVVSKAFFAPFFGDIPNVDFFAADLNGRHKGFFGLTRLASDVKMLGVDAIADLHDVLRSKVVRMVLAFSGIKTVVTDKARDEKKALTRTERKIFKPLKPVIFRHAEVFAELGFPIDFKRPKFLPKPLPDAEVQNLAGNKDGKWIGIAPFAQHNSKVYPFDLMQNVIDLLTEKEGNKIFLFGAGEKEIAVLNKFAKAKDNVVVVAGKISFRQELQLIANLDLMLSMDSGNGHIAAMYGVPVVTLWGATHPFAGFAPFGQPSENSLVPDLRKYPDLPTSVYGNKKVPGYEDAMRTIDPKTVAQQIEYILEKGQN